MRKVTNNNSMFVKIMAGILAGLMIVGAVAATVMILLQ